MLTLIEREPPTPEHNLLEAMSLAPYVDAQFPQPTRLNPRATKQKPRFEDEDLMLQRETNGRCNQVSREVIAYLLDQCPEAFDRLLIVEADNDPNNTFCANLDPSRIMHDLEGDEILPYSSHAFAFCRSLETMPDGTKRQIWSATSPANHRAGSQTTPLKTLYRSPDLNQLLDAIKKDEGGEWPAAAEIELFTDDQHYRQPRFIPATGERCVNLEVQTVRRDDLRHRNPKDGSDDHKWYREYEPAVFETRSWYNELPIRYPGFAPNPGPALRLAKALAQRPVRLRSYRGQELPSHV